MNYPLLQIQDTESFSQICVRYFEQAMANPHCFVQVDRSTCYAIKHDRMRSVALAQHFDREKLSVRHGENYRRRNERTLTPLTKS